MEIKTTEIPIELREKLADYINKLKDKRQLGFNQLSLKSGVNPGVLTKILKGTNKRVNPYQLKKIAYALRVDYKELYKIVGYLDEDDFGEDNKLKINSLEEINDNTELSDFKQLISVLSENEFKNFLQEFLDKKELEAYRNGTYEEKKEEFTIIREVIKNGYNK